MRRCALVVDNINYLDGNCIVSIDADGSFIIRTEPSSYFALVNISEKIDQADGYWNGELGISHADKYLGLLTKKGSCWINANARVCWWVGGK